MECADMSALSNGPTGRLIKGGGAAPHPKSGSAGAKSRYSKQIFGVGCRAKKLARRPVLG